MSESQDSECTVTAFAIIHVVIEFFRVEDAELSEGLVLVQRDQRDQPFHERPGYNAAVAAAAGPHKP